MLNEIMRDSKVVVTGFIWLVCLIISLALVFMLPGLDSEWLLTIPLGMAFFSTMAIYMSDSDKAKHQAKQGDGTVTIEKAKRDAGVTGSDPTEAKMRLLLELMDEDERQAFKETLKRQMLANSHFDDGEVDGIAMEALLEDQEKRLRG